MIIRPKWAKGQCSCNFPSNQRCYIDPQAELAVASSIGPIAPETFCSSTQRVSSERWWICQTKPVICAFTNHRLLVALPKSTMEYRYSQCPARECHPVKGIGPSPLEVDLGNREKKPTRTAAKTVGTTRFRHNPSLQEIQSLCRNDARA